MRDKREEINREDSSSWDNIGRRRVKRGSEDRRKRRKVNRWEKQNEI